MQKKLFFMFVCGVFFVSGCATTPANNSASANVIYTNAPIQVAFTASYTALTNLGYKIEKKDEKHYSVSGYCTNLLTGRDRIYAQIKLSQEPERIKIACTVDRPGAVKVFDVAGHYYGTEAIYEEITKILAHDELDYRRDRQKEEEKRSRESPDEDFGRPGDYAPRVTR